MSFESNIESDPLKDKKESILERLPKEGLTEDLRKEITEWRGRRLEQIGTYPTMAGRITVNYEMAQFYEYASDINTMFVELDEARSTALAEIDNPLNGQEIIDELKEILEKIEARIREMEQKYPA
jgi:uncharacterized coiled-coil DUF342 family protein